MQWVNNSCSAVLLMHSLSTFSYERTPSNFHKTRSPSTLTANYPLTLLHINSPTKINVSLSCQRVIHVACVCMNPPRSAKGSPSHLPCPQGKDAPPPSKETPGRGGMDAPCSPGGSPLSQRMNALLSHGSHTPVATRGGQPAVPAHPERAVHRPARCTARSCRPL